MATIRDVARAAGVSVATVSRVINGSSKVSPVTRAKVDKARTELNFSLNANARALAHHGSDVIGLMVSDASDPYFGSMIHACEMLATACHKVLIIFQGHHNLALERRAIHALMAHQCCGVVIHSLVIPDAELANYLRRIPHLVLINRILQGFEDRCVNIDNEYGEELATTALIESGHSKIAWVGSSRHILDAAQRESGYLKAMRRAGFPTPRELMLRVDQTISGGRQAAQQLLRRRGHFTAVACYNDAVATGLLATFQQNGLQVPGDISVVGFDDLEFVTCLNPPLSTISHPVENMGQEALKLSMALFDGQPYTLPPFAVHYIPRGSVDRPPRDRHLDELVRDDLLLY